MAPGWVEFVFGIYLKLPNFRGFSYGYTRQGPCVGSFPALNQKENAQGPQVDGSSFTNRSHGYVFLKP